MFKSDLKAWKNITYTPRVGFLGSNALIVICLL